MPPPAPTPMSANTTHFSLHHPSKLVNLRPNTWLALETLIEFIVLSYLTWALFYLIYLWICGAVWSVKGLRELTGRRKRGKEGKEQRRIEEITEEVTETNEGHYAPTVQQTEDNGVEDNNIRETPNDAGTHEHTTGRRRRMTL
ncbi:hypothetical protein DPSP01_009035 [Paraphaeosphaeria sporulosa]|uniref:Uncharacterized protein n=1 Tax=Paraphaeosphaeria sporulosa TaxID=1460663 RepID=A0A177C9E1_9PLEO|nr:uncharacterized protein CC84DRAFT_1218719 [Paraphaeosphaeria sporulosa]OAG03388.1 hypothetical protein CC84DRAFT_1218719 [Paraphaeosphaeria sporulosa]